MHKIETVSSSRWGGEESVLSARNHQNTARNSVNLVDYHNIVYKFNIIKDNYEVHLPFTKKMRNWTQEWDEIDGVKFQRTSISIIIFLNKRLKNKLSAVEIEGLELIKKYALIFQERYGIALDIKNPQPVRKEVKLLEGFRSADQFQGNLVKCVYPDGHIEFIDKSKAVEHTKNFIEGLAIENKADSLLKTMDGGFNTISFLMTKQTEILEKLTNNGHAKVNPFLKPLENLLKSASAIREAMLNA